MAIPKTDARLAEFSTNFNTRGSSDPGAYGLSVEQMEQYSVLHEAWMSAFHAIAGGAKNKALVAEKDQRKAELLGVAREFYALIQSSRSVSDANKSLIGVTIPKTVPTPRNAPTLAPLIGVLSVVGRVVRYTLADATAPGTRRRPSTAAGALIMTFIGNNPPPADGAGWKVEAQTGKNKFQVEFPNNVAPGTSCWVTVRWYSRRGDYSPASEPVRTYLQIGPVAEPAAPPAA